MQRDDRRQAPGNGVEEWDDADDAAPGFDARDLVRLHPRLLLASLLVSLVMVPVGIFVAAIGVWVLEFSGGAAHDTSVVVAIAGYLVSDFWGGGIVTTLTRARPPQVAASWTLARLLVLGLFVLVAPTLAPVLPVQLLLAVPVAYAGARVARKQASLRRQIRAEQEALAAAAAAPDAAPAGPERDVALR
ncbi:MAG: hypothetical protein JWM98_1073 [Thermoleophilia bacterium]|nr:hypothetical protein [Thermoleophilia bacterium]